MKFKINDRVWPLVQQYLSQNYSPQDYSFTQDPQKPIITLTIQTPINLQHLISQKLLIQFNKQKSSNQKLTLNQFMTNYNKKFQNRKLLPKQNIQNCTYLNYVLQLNQFHQQKLRIKRKKQILARLVQDNQRDMENFRRESQVQERKVQLGLQNVQYRMKLISGRNQEESNQQLQRVNNLIKNGIWNMAPQIQAKITQIKKLQNQIKMLKQSQNQNE